MNKKTKLSAAIGALVLVTTGSTMFVNADALTRQLQLGMSGADVGLLQTFLARDSSIYPEAKVTNYFGALTKAAVIRFQLRNAISAIGRVGPATMAAINAQLLNMGGTTTVPNGVAPISNVSISSSGSGMVTVNWSTPTPSKATVYYSTVPLTTYEYDNSVSISGAATSVSNFQTSQSLQLTGLLSNTTYYYSIYTTDQNGNVNMTWPSTFRTN